MTEDELTERVVAIVRLLHDLKEDVLHGGGIQPEFDAGVLEGAMVILNASVDEEDPRVVAERHRQGCSRLLRAMAKEPPADAALGQRRSNPT